MTLIKKKLISVLLGPSREIEHDGLNQVLNVEHDVNEDIHRLDLGLRNRNETTMPFLTNRSGL